MRLLVFSDLHGEEIALEKLKELAAKEKVDYVLSCGDNSKAVSFLEDLIGSFSNFYLIPGNWEGKEANEFLLHDKHCVHGKRIGIDGLNLVGFGYSNKTPFGTYGELSEDEIYGKMKKLDIDNNTILLLHCPPKGHFDFVRDSHPGSSSVLKIIEEKKPLVVFFGHIHEHEGSEKFGESTLVKVPAANAMRACIVDIKDKKTSVSFISL